MGWVECEPLLKVFRSGHQYRTVRWEAESWPRYTLDMGSVDGRLQATIWEHVDENSRKPLAEWPALLTTEILQMLGKAIRAISPQGVFAEEQAIKGNEAQDLEEIIREAYASGIHLGSYWREEEHFLSYPLSPGDHDWDWADYVYTQRSAQHLLTEAEHQFWNRPEISSRPVVIVLLEIGRVLLSAGFSLDLEVQ
jgi:hypothetical protein